MAFVEYIVKDGDRWDSIADKAYGDATLFNKIIEANVSTTISPLLSAGSRIIIPIQEEADIQIDSSTLPPWKRN